MKKLLLLFLILWAFAAFACSDDDSIEEGNSQAGDYSYCGALTATCNAFYSGSPTACSQAAREQCSTFQPTFSEAFQSAVVSCAKEFSPCIADFHACIRGRSASATPTAVQAKVKEDFCAVCSDANGSDACARFFVDGSSAERTWGLTGVGLGVLTVNDTIAAEIGSACIGVDISASGDGGATLSDAGSVCNPLAFTLCAEEIVKARTTPTACQM